MKPHVWFSRCTQFALLLLPIITVSGQTVADPPPAQSPIRLSAVNDPVTGRTAFSFEGREEPPVIRAALGDFGTREKLPYFAQQKWVVS